MIRCLTFLFLVVFFIAGTAAAGDPMRTGIRTRLPDSVTTIGDAAQYYADVVGYNLQTVPPSPPECARIAQLTINPLYNSNIVLAVEDAILALLDPEMYLIIDHDHKLFSFKRGD